MRIRPGRNLIRLAFALAALSLLTFFWTKTIWLLIAAIAMISFAALSEYATLRGQFKRLSLKRTMPKTAGRNVKITIEFDLENEDTVPVTGLLRDVAPPECTPRFQSHPFQIAPNDRTQILSDVRIPIRGRHTFGPAWVRLVGSLGLIDAQQLFDDTGSVKILPEKFSSKEGLEQDAMAAVQLLDKLSVAQQHGVGTEFESLSEFRQGDDVRRIDWRATARMGYHVMRRYQIERHRDVMIVMDCGRLMGAQVAKGTKLDCAVDAGLMLSRVALESGDRCGLGMFDDKVLGYLPPQSGPKSIRWLSECVYDVQTQWRESDFSLMFATLQSRQAKRSLIVVISDIVDVETSKRFRNSLASLSRRHVVLFAALRTPLLKKIVHEPVESQLDGFKKAVTFRVLREREQAIHSLERGGIHIVDVEPDQLTVPLINQFIELRRRNLL